MKLLIIVPAYNEAESIVKVIEELQEKVPQFDYIIVNDGSKDNTAGICREHDFRMLDLPVNLGLTGAFQTGMRYACEKGYDAAIQIDADGQHDPAYIDSMIKEMEKSGCDIVIGSRFKNNRKPLTARMLGSILITGAIRLTTGKHIGDVTSGMRLFNKKMIKQFGYDIHYSPEPDTLAYLLNCGVQIREVQVTMSERIAGTSYLNLWNSMWYMLKMMFSILLFQWVRKRREK